MTKVFLNHPDIEAGFQQMSRIRMPKGVNGNPPLFDARREFGPPESALHTVDGHGKVGAGCFIMASAQSREKQPGMAVGLPVLSEQDERIIGKRNESVLGAFSALDMDQHPVGIDVGYLEE
jgi:hypothetical protein